MARKGTQVINSTTMAVLAIFVAATLAAMSLNLMHIHKVTLEEDITKIVSNRVASGVYGVDAYPSGKLEMDLDSTYRITEAENGEAVNVSITSSTEISNAVYQLVDVQSSSGSYSVSELYTSSDLVFENEDIRANSICIEKENDEIRLSGGSC